MALWRCSDGSLTVLCDGVLWWCSDVIVTALWRLCDCSDGSVTRSGVLGERTDGGKGSAEGGRQVWRADRQHPADTRWAERMGPSRWTNALHRTCLQADEFCRAICPYRVHCEPLKSRQAVLRKIKKSRPLYESPGWLCPTIDKSSNLPVIYFCFIYKYISS